MKDKPFGVFEPTGRRHRKTLFALFGVPVSYTRFSAFALPFMMLAALPYALFRERETAPRPLSIGALKYALLMTVTNYLHSIGHILGGRAVSAPMGELIITSTRQVNRYEGPQDHHPKGTHITRAMGGPLLNLLAALVAYLLFRKLGGRPRWLADFVFFNAAWGLGSFTPIESLDGGSILKHLRQ
jgi:hypothetical protein